MDKQVLQKVLIDANYLLSSLYVITSAPTVMIPNEMDKEDIDDLFSIGAYAALVTTKNLVSIFSQYNLIPDEVLEAPSDESTDAYAITLDNADDAQFLTLTIKLYAYAQVISTIYRSIEEIGVLKAVKEVISVLSDLQAWIFTYTAAYSEYLSVETTMLTANHSKTKTHEDEEHGTDSIDRIEDLTELDDNDSEYEPNESAQTEETLEHINQIIQTRINNLDKICNTTDIDIDTQRYAITFQANALIDAVVRHPVTKPLRAPLDHALVSGQTQLNEFFTEFLNDKNLFVDYSAATLDAVQGVYYLATAVYMLSRGRGSIDTFKDSMKDAIAFIKRAIA